MMKKYTVALVGLLLSMSVSWAVYAAEQLPSAPTGMTQEKQQAMTPQQALQRLQAGNERFVNGTPKVYDYKATRENTANGQYPFAMVIGCVDSRSPPNITFDQNIGDIFAGRVAGNVIETNMLGSMEFASQYAGVKLIAVVGHTSCGAVRGACAGAGLDNLRMLLENIQPAVLQTPKKKGETCNSAQYVDAIAKQNVINQVDAIYKSSEKIRRLVANGDVLLVGAMQDLATGKVDFFYTYRP